MITQPIHTPGGTTARSSAAGSTAFNVGSISAFTMAGSLGTSSIKSS